MAESAERIDPADDASIASWSKKLDVTSDQVKDAVKAVGDLASDVGLHLKGTRSTTNEDRVEKAD